MSTEPDWRGEHLLVVPDTTAPARARRDKEASDIGLRKSALVKRRKIVRRLHGEGVSVRDIAAQLGRTENSLRHDLVAMGLCK